MTAIRESLARYVTVRRALGASFYEPALALGHFVDLLEREGAEFITTRYDRDSRKIRHIS